MAFPHVDGFCLSKSGLDNLVRPDAGGADFHLHDRSVDQGADDLDVRLERALRVFHNVQTDAAFLLRQTTIRDMAANNLALAANLTHIAHCSDLFSMVDVLLKPF